MAAASGAGDLNAPHSEAPVLVLLDGFGVGGQHEAGPAAAGVELGPAEEQQRPAAGAVVVAGFVVLGEAPVKGRSVAFSRSTWYCSGVSSARHSASLRTIFSGDLAHGDLLLKLR